MKEDATIYVDVPRRRALGPIPPANRSRSGDWAPRFEDSERPIQFAPIGDIIRDLTGAEFLIKPYLRRDTVTVLFGDSGSYKTFLALHMGLCIAHGVSFCGKTPKQGAVYVICGEGHGGIGRRLRAWLDEYTISEPRNLYVSNIPAQLIEDGNARGAADVISGMVKETGQEPALIIIDTLSTNFGDGDESFNADVARLLRNVNLHIRTPFRSCVLIVHHTGHAEKSRERGAYAIRANADERIMVWGNGEDVVVMESLKVKDGPRWLPQAFKARPVALEGIKDSEGEQETSVVLDALDYVPVRQETEGLGPKQKVALQCLRALYDQQRANLREAHIDEATAIVTIEDWRAEIEARTGEKLVRQRFHEVKTRLEERNLINVDALYVRMIEDQQPSRTR